MNTRLVNTAAGVINAALTQNRTSAGIALALESAQMLMTPETAAELELLRVRVTELEALAAAATEYRITPPGTDQTPFIVRQDPAPDGTGWAVVHDPAGQVVRRVWTRGGWEMWSVLAHGERFCWPDGVAAVAEARGLAGGGLR